MLAMYYRGSAAAILVYDITRASTFKTLQNWVEELQSKGPKDIALAIAGNKADLEESRVRLKIISCQVFISLLCFVHCRRLIEHSLHHMQRKLAQFIWKQVQKKIQMFRIFLSSSVSYKKYACQVSD